MKSKTIKAKKPYATISEHNPFSCWIARRSNFRTTRVFLFPKGLREQDIRDRLARQLGPEHTFEPAVCKYASAPINRPTYPMMFPCVVGRIRQAEQMIAILFIPEEHQMTSMHEADRARALYLGPDTRVEACGYAAFQP